MARSAWMYPQLTNRFCSSSVNLFMSRAERNQAVWRSNSGPLYLRLLQPKKPTPQHLLPASLHDQIVVRQRIEHHTHPATFQILISTPVI